MAVGRQMKTSSRIWRVVFGRRRVRRVVRRRRTSVASKAQFAQYKAQAETLVRERLEYFNAIYNFKYNKITIRNQRSRWGSCSKKGNINFNYKIALISPELADYIIVHELCHLGEFNHSKKFWDLVAKTIPEYRERRAELKKVKIK